MALAWKSLFTGLRRLAEATLRRRRSRPDPIPSHLSGVVSREPGLSCPRCSFRIPIAIPMLLSGQPIICPRCFLRLNVDREKSGDSLHALEKLESDFARARDMMKQR